MDLLARCRDLALPFYGNLLQSAQQSARDRLFEQAGKAVSNDDQRCFYEAIQQLNAVAADMQQVFKDQLQHSYQQFLLGRDEDEAPPQRSGKLSLVAREQLEDELAISMIVSRANSHYSETLWKLNRRLAALRGGKKVTDDSNPFGPAKVGLALRRAMAELDVELKARIFIYKHIGKLLLAIFGKVFDSLNATLVDAGVLPNLKFAISKDADEPDSTPDLPAAEPPTPQDVAGDAEQRQLYNSIVEQLRARLGTGPRERTVSGISYGGLQSGRDGAPQNFVPLDYALALSGLQQAPEFHAGAAIQRPLPIDVVEQRLFAQLSKQAKPDQRHQVGERDADTVDLVGMVFRFMLDDPKIPDVVKSLLSHLHTPYLKLALLDPTFLENRQHPARVLLNQMAETGARWVVDDKERTVLPKLKAIVETVLRGFVDDISLFDRLLEDFARFREGLDKRAQMVEKRNRSAQEGIERLTVAKQRAAREISERMKGFAVPDAIEQLLHKPWTDFLAFNYLRNGENSLSWKAALKVVDGVLWSVRDHDGRSPEEFQRYQSQLEQSIAEGLRTIGYDSEAGEQMLSALRAAQEQAFRGQPAVVPKPEPATPAGPEAIQPSPEQFSPAEQELVETLRNHLEFGTLFEFDRPGQRPQLFKLAWYSRVSAHYMFVNQAGIKQRVETLPALVRGLHAGTIRIVQPEKRSFMERALTAILHKLRLTT
jgi:hypothetical protein